MNKKKTAKYMRFMQCKDEVKRNKNRIGWERGEYKEEEDSLLMSRP